MALINADSFGNLAAVSVSANNVKIPTKFFNVCISGKRRGKMNQGYLQCPVSFNDNGQGDFFVLNEDNVYFLPLYIKKYWVKYSKITGKDGTTFDAPVAMGWEDNIPKIDGAKTEYIIAGYLWDNEKKNIVKHSKDLEDNEIKAGEPVLIYFRCRGTKCNCAYELVHRVNEAAKTLKALSDNPTFEQNIINPRRFMIKTSIIQKDSNYGPVDVFDFNVEQTLPDDLVAKILDAANNKFLDDFNKQFDRSKMLSNKTTTSNTSQTPQSTNTGNEDVSVDVPDVSSEAPNPGDDFNIEI